MFYNSYVVHKNIHIKIAIVLATILLFSSCKEIDVFEKNTNIPNMQWQNNFAATGNFIITDTTKAYNVYVVLRHTDAYKYNNIWLGIQLKAPNNDTAITQKINLQLGSDATGWEGVGINDIWEVRKLIVSNSKLFTKKGTYSFSIYQIMRNNPLKDVMSIGLNVQKLP